MSADTQHADVQRDEGVTQGREAKPAIGREKKGEPDDQKAVARVVGNERNFIGMEAQIQGVQHAPRYRHAEVSFHMFGLIPQKRGHAVSTAQAEAGERADGDSERAADRFGKRVLVEVKAQLLLELSIETATTTRTTRATNGLKARRNHREAGREILKNSL